jgi:hypothetical protein
MKRWPLFPLILVLLASCGSKQSGFLPSEIKVLRDGGITARATWQKDADKSGAVLKDRSYKVIDGLPGALRVKLADGTTGWISAGQDASWISLQPGRKVKIVHPGGISVREQPFDTASPALAGISEGRECEVLAIEYTHYLVRLSEGGQGWIFAGRKDDPWVKAD